MQLKQYKKYCNDLTDLLSFGEMEVHSNSISDTVGHILKYGMSRRVLFGRKLLLFPAVFMKLLDFAQKQGKFVENFVTIPSLL